MCSGRVSTFKSELKSRRACGAEKRGGLIRDALPAGPSAVTCLHQLSRVVRDLLIEKNNYLERTVIFSDPFTVGDYSVEHLHSTR